MAFGSKVIVAGYTYLDGAEFFISDAQPALPVTLLSFNGELIKKDAALNWQTTNEVNNNYFNVQRSTGSAFINIGKVNAANGVATVQRYAYIDTGVTALGVGALYYRLQQVDNDGKINYSNVIKLQTGINDDIMVLPNPAHKIAFVRSPVNVDNALITITDASGHTVYTSRKNIQASVPVPLNVSALTNGTYVVTIQAPGVNRQSRLVLQ